MKRPVATKTLVIRVTSLQKREFEQVAQARGLCVSAWLRSVATQAVEDRRREGR